jgi:hypothetical protein
VTFEWLIEKKEKIQWFSPYQEHINGYFHIEIVIKITNNFMQVSNITVRCIKE